MSKVNIAQMQPAAPAISTCPACGRVLEQTSGGVLACIMCCFRVGIGGEDEDEPSHHSTSTDFEGDEHFGIYAIERCEDGSLYELGRGAMGVTYCAIDTTLQRKVALKIIKIGLATRSAEARERFMREARAAAALRHENIATVFQFGIREETGQCFYAMELIEGETLEQRVRRTGPLDVRTTIEIALQVTAALAAAEKRGLIHRDLKPANLMLISPDREAADADLKDETPAVRVIDFGLAKALKAPADPMRLTHDGFVGTPAFASPEQFAPKRFEGALDVRSDIYSLGATLWFVLTGKTPFGGQGFEEIRRAQQSDVLPLEQLKAARVPPRLRALLKSMLAFEPAARPGTHELTTELRCCAADVRGKRRARVSLAAAAILILGVAAFFVFYSVRTENSASNPPAPEKSIAVLPFENLSRDPDNAYFAEGIQEEILTRLAKIAGLKVISRTSTQQYQSKPRNLGEIAKQLGVANIVEGSVQKAADQVRVNVQLINAQSDSHLWAETYDRKSTDIFSLESEVATGIAESLLVKFTGGEEKALAAKPTNNAEAYDAYLRGVAVQGRGWRSSNLPRKTISYFERAVQLDPNFAAAWARLSQAHSYLCFQRVDNARPDVAKDALERTQKLQPNSPETLLALGYYQYWVMRDYALAKATFQLVNKLLPNNSEVAWALSVVNRRDGNWNDSVAWMERALATDPRNGGLITTAAWTYEMLRQFPKARELYDRALDIVASDPDLLAAEASVYQAEGNLEQAHRLLSDITADTPFEAAFFIKVTQLRLERNHKEAVRLLQARLAQSQFTSEFMKGVTQVLLVFAQRLADNSAGAKVTAEQARTTLESLCKNQPDKPNFAAWLSLAYAALDKKDLALKEAERAIKLVSNAKDAVDGPGAEENLALIQAMFGENSRALSTLGRLLQTPFQSSFYNPAPLTSAFLTLDPLWDPLHADPSFQKLCEEK